MTTRTAGKRTFFRNPLVWLVALVGVLLAGGALWETVALSADRTAHPAPGRLVDMDGYNLHLDCRGEGDLTYVLTHDRGTSSIAWSLVQPELAGYARVCAWDRAGYGYSDAGRLLTSPQAAAEQLHELLERGGEKGPYVAVGHGFGTFVSRAFADGFTDEVKGLMLIDALHEDMRSELPPDYYDFALELAQGETQLGNAARFGLLRMLKAWSPESYERMLSPSLVHYPADVRQAYEREHLRASTWKASYEEFMALDTITAEMRALKDAGAHRPPTAVLLAGDSLAGFLPDELPNGFPIPEAARAWQLLQLDLVGRDGSGVFVLVRNTGHDIPLQQPNAVLSMAAHLFTTLTGSPPPGMADPVSAATKPE